MSRALETTQTDAITLRVHRLWAERFEDLDSRRALHTDRAALVHAMVDGLELEVADWGLTDSEHPREVVEIVIGVASGLVTEAIAGALRAWWGSRKVKDVEIVGPDERAFALSDLNDDELKALGQFLWDTRRAARMGS